MRLTRSLSKRKSIHNYDARPSEHHNPPSPAFHRNPSPSTTTSISSISSKSISTPLQPNFPSYNSENFPYYYHPLHSPSESPSACNYPSSESKSVQPPRPISRIRSCISNVGFTSQTSTKLHTHQSKSKKPLNQGGTPPSAQDQSEYSNISKASRKRIQSSTVHNYELTDTSSKPSVNPQSESVRNSSKSNQIRTFYGIITHSFTAERLHELDVQAGEAVIINAYNDQGWLICKPIGRLGGPGLVPITLVQICDMASGEQLSSDDTFQFLHESGLPRAADWKQAVAAYRLNSIQLGSSETPSFSASSESVVINLTSGSLEASTEPDYIRKTIEQDQSSSPSVLGRQLRQVTEQPRFPVSRPVGGSSSDFNQPTPRYGPLIRAAVESFREEGGRLVFMINVRFASLIDSEPSQRIFVIHRTFKDWLAFDTSFRARLKYVSDSYGEQLDLPSLATQVSRNAEGQRWCSHQLENIKCYLFELSCASLAIRDLREVCDFLSPSEAHLDFERSAQLVQDATDEDSTQYFNENAILNTQGYFHFHLALHDRSQSPSGQQTPSPGASVPSHSCRSSEPISDYTNNPSSEYNSSNKSLNLSSRVADHQVKSFYRSDGEFTKIKIYDLQCHDVMVLKVSSRIGLKELINKITERFHYSSSTPNPSSDITARRKIVPKHLVTDPSNDMDSDFIDCDDSGDELESASPRTPGKLAKFSSDENLWNWMLTQDRLVIYI